MFEYFIAQLEYNHPGECTKGIDSICQEVNLWKSMRTQAIGPSMRFPPGAYIKGGQLVLTIMNKYSEKEAQKLFVQDTTSTADDDNKGFRPQVNAAQGGS